MKTKVNIVYFTLNSIFLIGQKMTEQRTLEASNGLPVNVGQLIFIPSIVCIMALPCGIKTLDIIAFLSE